MPDTIDRAVHLSDLVRVRNVVRVLAQLYDPDTWTGGMVFSDSQTGFLFVASFDPDRYNARELPWELLFPEDDLRSTTLELALADHRRYRPFLAGDIPLALRALKLLPI